MAEDDYCYLTTTGRRTGGPHRIEIWYAAHGDTLYLLSGGGRRSDWVQNLIADPAVTVELKGDVRAAARVLDGGGEAGRGNEKLTSNGGRAVVHPSASADCSATPLVGVTTTAPVVLQVGLPVCARESNGSGSTRPVADTWLWHRARGSNSRRRAHPHRDRAGRCTR